MLLEKDLKSEKARELYRTYFWFMKTPKTAAEEKPAKNETTIQAMPLQKEKPAEAKTAPALKTDVFSEPKKVEEPKEAPVQAEREVKEVPAPVKAEAEPKETPKVEVVKPLVEIVKATPLMLPAFKRGDNILKEGLDYFAATVIMDKEVTPVVEEAHNCLIALVGVPGGLSTLIVGKSGNSKSLIMDKEFELMPGYVPLNSGSKKGIIDLVDEINNAGAVYVHELQEAIAIDQLIKEALKHFSENKEWRYTRNGDIIVFKKGIRVGSTGAYENIKMQGMDVEVLSRYIILKTKEGDDKYEAICEDDDKRDAEDKKDRRFSKARFERLKSHIEAVSKDNLTSTKNPFAIYFGEEYLPITQKSIRYRKIFKSLINCYALFDKPNRVAKEENKLIINLADLYLAHNTYYKTYCEILESLASRSFEAISKNLPKVDAEKEKEKYEHDIALIKEKASKDVNWQGVWNSGYEIMKRNNPSLLEEWVSLQTRGKDVVVYDPILDKDVFLCDSIPGGQNDAENRAA